MLWEVSEDWDNFEVCEEDFGGSYVLLGFDTEREYVVDFVMRTSFGNFFIDSYEYFKEVFEILVFSSLRSKKRDNFYVSNRVNRPIFFCDDFTADEISNIYRFFSNFFLFRNREDSIITKKHSIEEFSLWYFCHFEDNSLGFKKAHLSKKVLYLPKYIYNFIEIYILAIYYHGRANNQWNRGR